MRLMDFGRLFSSAPILAMVTEAEAAKFREALAALRTHLLVTGGLFLAVLAALVVYLYSTRSGIIARATTKEALRQPVFSLLVALSLTILVLNTFVPFFSLGDDVK